MRAGAGRAPIVYPHEVWPIDGFGGQHDTLWVRTLLLEIDGERAALAVLDQTALAPEPLEAVRGVLAGTLGLEGSRVLVGVSHTFSAPHLPTGAGEEAVRAAAATEAVLAATRRSARDALEALRPAVLAAGAGACAVNVNRDVETPTGWGLGVNEAGFSDPAVQLLRLRDADGADIAVLVNYAVQPSVMNGSRDAAGLGWVSGDLAGEAMRHVERTLTGATAFFLIGAAGDQAPALTAVRRAPVPVGAMDAGIAAFLASELLGERLGTEVLRVAEIADPVASAPLALHAGVLVVAGQEPVDRLAFTPTRSHVYLPAAERELPYWILALGDVAVVGVQVELSAETGARIRDASAFATTLVVTMVNGGAKYLPEASAFDRMTYEALSSRYARGSAELLENAVLDDLARLSRHVPAPTERSTS